MTAATGSRQHRGGEVAADRIIHIMGTLVAVVGSAILVGIAALSADRPVFYASVVYSFCLLMMLACSAAYNLATDASRRGFLRRLDHAVIFLMIAGTYTPFTTCRLHGVWAIGMTVTVWTGAVTGAVMKLISPRRVERVSVDARTAVLIGVGGVLYSTGVGFHLWRALPFQKAIWHSFVLVAASCHYAAILCGVVLARS